MYLIKRYDGALDPPPGHWKPTHISTRTRFKAQMTCSEGHGLVLKNHTIDDEGKVSPSVVCKTSSCSFHEFVLLDGWDFGNID